MYFKFDFKKCDVREFVHFWSSMFREPSNCSDDIYFKNLGGKVLTTKNIRNLFSWKNSCKKLSKNREKIIKRICKEIRAIYEFRKIEVTDHEAFLEDFLRFVGSKNLTKSAFHKFFLLHIIKPRDFPIIDKNTLRAYFYLGHGNLIKDTHLLITKANYLGYKKFFDKMIEESRKTSMEVYRALWTFGEFIENDGFAKGLSNYRREAEDRDKMVELEELEKEISTLF